jgi:hypothetical protein
LLRYEAGSFRALEAFATFRAFAAIALQAFEPLQLSCQMRPWRGGEMGAVFLTRQDESSKINSIQFNQFKRAQLAFNLIQAKGPLELRN